MLWLAPEEAGYLLSVGDKRGGWVAQEHSRACLPSFGILICFVDKLNGFIFALILCHQLLPEHLDVIQSHLFILMGGTGRQQAPMGQSP